ncbi:hypothetical protein CM15mP99_3230 [bacterium]|nr:MAG: hypothetical protein CM15mP99_3230 [bacterium]
MENNENFVKVTIYGQEYTIKAPADASYIKNIAEFVDERMRSSRRIINSSSSSKNCYLAAMNIADELFTRNKDYDNMQHEVEGKVSNLLEIVEEAIHNQE